MTRLHLFSGGLDSLCLWFLTGRPVPVYVRLGHRYQDHEIAAIHQLAAHIRGFSPCFIDGPPIGSLEHRDGHIPHRNLLLAATAAAHFPSAETIVLGALLGEASPDKSRAFTEAAGRALAASERRPVRVTAPARRWTKTGLLQRFVRTHPEHAPLLGLTRSCYARDTGPCGACSACFRRDVAMFHAGLATARPRMPAGVGLGDAVRAARTAGPARWHALAANNALAALAMAGVRRPGRPRH